MDDQGRWPRFLSRLKGTRAKSANDEFEEEIISMVNEGQEQGVLQESEAEMIQNIFEFGDTEVADIMTRRGDVSAIDCETTLQDAVVYILQENQSRYPVYREDLDDVVGILHFRDAIIYNQKAENKAVPIGELPELLRKPHFVPETKKIDSLFKEMQSGKIHIGIVVDEYGQTAGVVTMEDILEEIVGNILDEYDEDEQLIIHQEDGSYLMDGMTLIEDLEKTLGEEFADDDNETLNGLLISELDRIPAQGEQLEITLSGYLFQILSVEGNAIHQVRVSKIEDLNEESSGEEE